MTNPTSIPESGKTAKPLAGCTAERTAVIAPDPAMIRRGLEIYSGRKLLELRALKGRRDVSSGYYDADHFEQAAAEAARLSAAGWNVYQTANPLVPSLLARSANRQTMRPDWTTSDADVTDRRVLLIDIDTKRPAGISATDEEYLATRALATSIRGALMNRGWPEPIAKRSGNGAHLNFAIGLPNDDESRELLKRVLLGLAFEFDIPTAKIDRTPFNAARIERIPGTLARKGDDLPDRPHRLCEIAIEPERFEPVPRQLLEAMAARAPDAAQRRPQAPRVNGHANGHGSAARSLELVQRVLRELGIEYQERAEGDTTKLVLSECPNNRDHKDAAIFIASDGKLTAHCFHDSCAGMTWAKDFRERIDGPRPAYRERVPNDDDERRADAVAERDPHADRAPEVAPARTPSPLWIPSDSDRFTVEELEATPPPVRCAIYPVLPLGKPALFIAAGGGSKTGTTLAMLAKPICIGGDFFGEPVMSGAVVYITAEDSRGDLLRVLHENTADLSAMQRAMLADRLHVKDLTGTGFKLTYRLDGRTIVTPETDELAAWAAEIAEVRLIVLDTLSRLHGGEESNDDLSRYVEAMERIAKATGAAVLSLHHTGKAQMREGLSDQYYSRGGSALSDNARSVFNLTTVKADQPDAPCNAAELIADGRLLRLTHAKVNHVRPSIVRYIERAIGKHAAILRPFAAEFSDADPSRGWVRVGEWLRTQKDVPFPTARTIDELPDEYGSRLDRRKALNWATDRQLIGDAPHPDPQGRRKTYLKLTDDGCAALDAADPDGYLRASRGR